MTAWEPTANTNFAAWAYTMLRMLVCCIIKLRRHDHSLEFAFRAGLGWKDSKNEVSMCPARRTANVKSICPASVNHVSYRVRSRGFSLAGRPLHAAQIATQTFLDSRHNPIALA